MPAARMSSITVPKSCHTKCGSMKRSCSAVPQRTGRTRSGCSQKRATSARSSSACSSDIRGCGGISNARSSTSPWRPDALSGEYSLSMQNSARWVLPVRSTSRWRSARSTTHGGGDGPARSSCCSAISSSYRLSWRASSTRGAWLVGPMKAPENR